MLPRCGLPGSTPKNTAFARPRIRVSCGRNLAIAGDHAARVEGRPSLHQARQVGDSAELPQDGNALVADLHPQLPVARVVAPQVHALAPAPAVAPRVIVPCARIRRPALVAAVGRHSAVVAAASRPQDPRARLTKHARAPDRQRRPCLARLARARIQLAIAPPAAREHQNAAQGDGQQRPGLARAPRAQRRSHRPWMPWRRTRLHDPHRAAAPAGLARAPCVRCRCRPWLTPPRTRSHDPHRAAASSLSMEACRLVRGNPQILLLQKLAIPATLQSLPAVAPVEGGPGSARAGGRPFGVRPRGRTDGRARTGRRTLPARGGTRPTPPRVLRARTALWHLFTPPGRIGRQLLARRARGWCTAVRRAGAPRPGRASRGRHTARARPAPAGARAAPRALPCACGFARCKRGVGRRCWLERRRGWETRTSRRRGPMRAWTGSSRASA